MQACNDWPGVYTISILKSDIQEYLGHVKAEFANGWGHPYSYCWESDDVNDKESTENSDTEMARMKSEEMSDESSDLKTENDEETGPRMTSEIEGGFEPESEWTAPSRLKLTRATPLSRLKVGLEEKSLLRITAWTALHWQRIFRGSQVTIKP